MPKLFDEEEVDAVDIRVNETFANKYQSRKEKEQLTQLAAKYRQVDAKAAAQFMMIQSLIVTGGLLHSVVQREGRASFDIARAPRAG